MKNLKTLNLWNKWQKKQLEKMRSVAKEEAAKLWHKRKEMEKSRIEAGCKRQELLKIEQERKRQKEIELANQWKQ